MSDDQAIVATRHWLEDMVIGLNLCPFASAPYRQDSILYRVCRESAPDPIYRAALQSLQDLTVGSAQDHETALLIVPDGLAAFDDYLCMVQDIEHAIGEAGLEGVIQVASFHPAYRFADGPADDPANYSNRSPFPMFHFIREQGLADALASVSEPERIPERNIRRLRALGLDGIRAILSRR